MKKEYQEIGHVSDIYRYPVKSMKGEKIVEEIKLGWHGLAGDRRFAFLRVGNRSGLPWLTMRQLPKLILYSPRFQDLVKVESSPILVNTPLDKSLFLDSHELIEEIEQSSRQKLELIQLWRGAFDSMTLSMISTSSIRSIAALLGHSIEYERFRPNIVLELTSDKPYPEERLVGALIVFGNRDNSARVRIYRKDLRCMVVNLDPETAKQNPLILKEIVKNRKNFLGVYGGTERPGTIRADDLIYLVKD